MAFCTTCGTDNSNTSAFCSNCGSKMGDTQPAKNLQEPSSYQEMNQNQQQQPQYQQQPPQYQQGPPQYQQYPPPGYGYQPTAMGGRLPRTSLLTLVIAINWMGVALIMLGGILFILFAAEFETEFGFGGGVFAAFALFFIVFGALIAWLTVELNKYNNTARIIQIIFSSLGFLTALSGFDPFSLVISGLAIYTLGFHKETVDLFKQFPRYQ